MPNTHATLSALFTDIASAIREKSGTSGTIIADNFPSAIQDIPTGGGGEKPTLPQGNYIYDSITKFFNYDLAKAGDFGSIITVSINSTTLFSHSYSAPYTGSVNIQPYITPSIYQTLSLGDQNLYVNYKPNASLASFFNLASTVNFGSYYYQGYYVESSVAKFTIPTTTSYTSNLWVPSTSVAKLVYQGGN